MAVTLVGFLGLRVAITLLARPHYLPALTHTIPDRGAVFDGNWQLAREFVDANGTPIVPDAQGNMAFGPGVYVKELYQPADRYWLFQGIETGIFIALAVLLLLLTIQQIRRIA